MIHLHFIISTEHLALLADFIEASRTSLDQKLAVQPIWAGYDTDLVATWTESLAEALRSDLNILTDLVQYPSFGKKSFPLEDAIAEGALRAASAIRIRLQQNHFMHLEPHLLESGQVDPQVLAENAQQAYVAYQLLGALQASILAGMDPQLLS